MNMLEWRGVVLICAVGLDLLFGEPPNRFHPVAWMGSVIGRLKRACSSERPSVCFFWGLGIIALGVFGLAAVGLAIEWLFPRPVSCEFGAASYELGAAISVISLLIQALVLKCCFGIRSLTLAAETVGRALHAGDLVESRRQLSYHLVSRDSEHLDEAQISAAAIESVAENTSDSFVAPVLFYLVAGIPGALAYRYVNTCDAMLGYRTPKLEWLGKVPARTDDLLNLLPARMTAALMIASSCFRPNRIPQAIRIWWKDSGKTESPNAGHPMSVAAGLLHVRLAKEGHYILGEDLPAASMNDITAMRLLFRRTVFTTIAVASAVCVFSWRLYP